jgi:hypothetical protein
MSTVPFENLTTCDLIPGQVLESGIAGTIADEPISKAFGVGNAGGFRFKGTVANTRLVVLYSTGLEKEWPNANDAEQNEYKYFGDNKVANSDPLVTPHGGNQILKRAFDSSNLQTENPVPLFALLRKTGSGRDAELVGFAVPKFVCADGQSGLREVQIPNEHGVVRNFLATFELLDVGSWPRAEFQMFMSEGQDNFLDYAPQEFRNWIAELIKTSDATNDLNEVGGNPVELDIRPDAKMLDIFENITYTPWFALGELVDNSISSFMELRDADPDEMKSKHLEIKITWDSVQKVIRVEDNAGGIKLGPSGWDRVLKVGKKKDNPKHLSVFGYGLKAAGLWWSPKLTVESKVAGESVKRWATVDRNNLNEANTVTLFESEAPVADHYTKVTLTGLNKNRSIPTGGAVSRIQDYLSSMYRVYLRGDSERYQDNEGNPWLRIRVQSTWLKAPKQELLTQPFWPTTNGPDPEAELVTWKTDVLQFHIQNDETGITKTISGWVGLLKHGKPNDAGFLMLFRGKGIVGVGQGVGSNTDLYRPAAIVGSGNTNRRQRMVGEFDVSAFGKSVTTDAIDWSEEEEAEFLKQLESKLKDASFNIWAMAENWRPTKLIEMPPSATATYDGAAGDAVEAVERENRRPGSVLSSPVDIPQETQDNHPAFDSSELAFEKDFEVAGTMFRFVGALSGKDSPWLSVFEDSSAWVIQINQDHPFMRSFAYVPGHDPKSLYRIAIAIALAEIKSDPKSQRHYINSLLDGPIGSTAWDEEF